MISAVNWMSPELSRYLCVARYSERLAKHSNCESKSAVVSVIAVIKC